MVYLKFNHLIWFSRISQKSQFIQVENCLGPKFKKKKKKKDLKKTNKS